MSNAETLKDALGAMKPARPEEIETLMEGLAVRGIEVSLEEMEALLAAGADGGLLSLYLGWCEVLKAYGAFVVKEVGWVSYDTGLPEAFHPYLLHCERDGTYTEWNDPGERHSGAWIMDVE